MTESFETVLADFDREFDLDNEILAAGKEGLRWSADVVGLLSDLPVLEVAYDSRLMLPLTVRWYGNLPNKWVRYVQDTLGMYGQRTGMRAAEFLEAVYRHKMALAGVIVPPAPERKLEPVEGGPDAAI